MIRRSSFSVLKGDIVHSGGWLDQHIEQYEQDPDYVAEGLALHLVEEALRLMEEKGISRSELASQMGVSKAYITRLFNAPPNLTLRSIAHLALALGTKPHASLLAACPTEEREPGSITEANTASLQAD